jgi:cyclophilin family peptidyl-prolyl cis-trans isomerase
MNNFFIKIVLSMFFLMMVKTTVDASPKAILKTSKGDIEIELNKEKAPISVDNFLSYAKAGFYNGLIFHRVIDGFMIQGGGFSENGIEKSNPSGKGIKNEAGNGLVNEEMTLAMARTSDVNSATSQFFINVANNVFLNHKDESSSGFGYAVFGKVIKGTDVVNKIAKASTKKNGAYADWPEENIVIKEVVVLE